MKKIYFFALLCFSSLTFAQSPLLTEDFNYPAADLLNAHGWNIHSGTTNTILVTSPGLTFAGYVGSNIGLAAGVNNTGADMNKLFTAQTAAGSIYTSFLVNVTAIPVGGYFFHIFDPALATAFRARTFIIPSADKMNVGFSFNASAAQATSTTLLNLGETYLFVVKYTIVDGATNDNVSLYVFAAGENFSTEPATPTLGPLSTADATTDVVPTGIALRQYDAGQRITVDGFRVKKSWQMGLDTPTGINEMSSNRQIGFYPNPVTDGFLNISTSAKSLKQIEIYDIVGKKVFNETTISDRINVSDLKAGIYILKVDADNRSTSSKLIIK